MRVGAMQLVRSMPSQKVVHHLVGIAVRIGTPTKCAVVLRLPDLCRAVVDVPKAFRSTLVCTFTKHDCPLMRVACLAFEGASTREQSLGGSLPVAKLSRRRVAQETGKEIPRVQGHGARSILGSALLAERSHAVEP